MSIPDIRNKLKDISENIKNAKGGAAIGIAMKHLKTEGISIDGNDVRLVVEEIQKA